MMHIDVGEWQIRSFRTQDAEALARHANNRNVSRNLRDAFPYPYTLARAETWISFATHQSMESDTLGPSQVNEALFASTYSHHPRLVDVRVLELQGMAV